MANSHNDFKPRRSRRSGVKKLKQIKANLEILNKVKCQTLTNKS